MGKCIEHVRVGEADGIWYIEDEREHDDGYKAVVGCEIERLVSRVWRWARGRGYLRRAKLEDGDNEEC